MNTIDLSTCVVFEKEAEEYLLAAELLYSKLEIDKKGLPSNLDLACPYVFLACFVIEVSIKNLLIKESIAFNKEHHLVQLFNMLPKILQEKIIDNRKANWIAPFADYSRKESDFMELLTKENNNFMDIRYHFETKTNSVTTCISFLHCLSNVVVEVLEETI